MVDLTTLSHELMVKLPADTVVLGVDRERGRDDKGWTSHIFHKGQVNRK